MGLRQEICIKGLKKRQKAGFFIERFYFSINNFGLFILSGTILFLDIFLFSGGSAKQKEKQLKKWNRRWKIRLIEQLNPTWGDLFGEVIKANNPGSPPAVSRCPLRGLRFATRGQAGGSGCATLRV
jgi:hypothetical protein